MHQAPGRLLPTPQLPQLLLLPPLLVLLVLLLPLRLHTALLHQLLAQPGIIVQEQQRRRRRACSLCALMMRASLAALLLSPPLLLPLLLLLLLLLLLPSGAGRCIADQQGSSAQEARAQQAQVHGTQLACSQQVSQVVQDLPYLRTCMPSGFGHMS